MKSFSIAIAVAAALIASSANAIVVASSLPYNGTPDWTDIVFAGTSMNVAGSESVLTTANNQGVWFGWSSSSNPPSWSMASNAQGNYCR